MISFQGKLLDGLRLARTTAILHGPQYDVQYFFSVYAKLMAATEFLGDWSLGTGRVRSRRTDPAGLVEFVSRGLVGQYTERGCCSLVFLLLPTMNLSSCCRDH
jgi:hypothetical protein